MRAASVMHNAFSLKGREFFPQILVFTVYIGKFRGEIEGRGSQKPEARRSKRAALVLVPFLLLASGFLLLASSPQQTTLKVDVNLVNVFVAVKDAAGNFVTGLSQDDFRIYDDDELQKIDVFETQ